MGKKSRKWFDVALNYIEPSDKCMTAAAFEKNSAFPALNI